ncbi:MAG: TauD/TfdA family dioxygenase [Novosphingobium sp.]
MAHISSPQPGRPLVLVEPEAETALAQLDPDQITALYKTHGALLLRGFGADLDAFHAFAKRLSRTAVVNESPGRTALDAAKSVYTVDGGTNAFALHPELSREPWKPDLAMFGCLSAPGEGGRTTVCDGIELAKALPSEVRQGLVGRRLVYLKGVWPELLQFWLGTATPDDNLLRSPPAHCPYKFLRDSNGLIARYFSRPALHKPMFAEELAFGNFLLFARFNNGRGDYPLLDDMRPVPEDWLQAIKLAGDRLTYAVEWQQGDVVMLDNTRFLHGRTAILDPAERQIATYFGYLDFAIPDPEEPTDAIWRRADFDPPHPPLDRVRRV